MAEEDQCWLLPEPRAHGTSFAVAKPQEPRSLCLRCRWSTPVVDGAEHWPSPYCPSWILVTRGHTHLHLRSCGRDYDRRHARILEVMGCAFVASAMEGE